MIANNSIMISVRGGQYLVSRVRARNAKRGEIVDPLYRLRKIAKISVWGNGEFTESELLSAGLRPLEDGKNE